MPKRFNRSGLGWGNPTVPAATTLTAHATPHTKGDWTEIMAAASVARDCWGFRYSTTVSVGGSNSTLTSMLIDFGLGGSGTSVDRSIIENIPVGGWMGSQVLEIPCHIPAGVRLCARVQAAVTVDTIAGRVICLYGNEAPYFGGFYGGDALSIDTANSIPSTGDLTDNAWDQVIASTSREYGGFSIQCCLFDASATAVHLVVDAGIGAGGSEQMIGSDHVEIGANEQVWQNSHPFYMTIPAGSRLALRKNDTADLSGTILGWY